MTNKKFQLLLPCYKQGEDMHYMIDALQQKKEEGQNLTAVALATQAEIFTQIGEDLKKIAGLSLEIPFSIEGQGNVITLTGPENLIDESRRLDLKAVSIEEFPNYQEIFLPGEQNFHLATLEFSQTIDEFSQNIRPIVSIGSFTSSSTNMTPLPGDSSES